MEQSYEHQRLRIAIHYTFRICAHLVHKRHTAALGLIVKNPALMNRAATMILNNVLRMVLDKEDLPPKSFDNLVGDLAKLANES